MQDRIGLSVDETGIAALSVGVLSDVLRDRAARERLSQELKRAAEHPDVRVLFLLGHGWAIPPCADTAGIQDAGQSPRLDEICILLENFEHPVVAVLSGLVIGEGSALALAAHYRLASDDVQIGFSDLAQGLVPGAGATQRLPRLVGVCAALEMMLTKRWLPVSEAATLGLVDQVVSEDVMTGVRAYARRLLAARARARPASARREALRNYSDQAMAIAEERAAHTANPVPAAMRIIDCVEAAAILPFEAGLAFEETACAEVATSPEAQALRHQLRARVRLQSRVKAHVPKIAHLGIAGAGMVPVACAVRALHSGLRVTLSAPTEMGCEIALEGIMGALDEALAQGRISPVEYSRGQERLMVAVGLDALAPVEAVIATIPDALPSARAVLPLIERAAPNVCALAVLGQGVRLSALSDALERPERLLGLSFADVPGQQHLIEIALPEGPAADGAMAFVQMCERMRLIAVTRTDIGIGIGHRLAAAALRAADYILAQGATPYEVDVAMRGFGMACGPYEQLDLVGIDRSVVGGGILERALLDQGRSGRSVGAGYYDYGTSGAVPSQLVLSECEALWQRLDVVRHDFSDRQIAQRLMAAMANAGAHALGEGAADHATDIDLVAVEALGMASWRGGPMFQADITGLLPLKRLMQELSIEDAEYWYPAPLLEEMIKNGRRFCGA